MEGYNANNRPESGRGQGSTGTGKGVSKGISGTDRGIQGEGMMHTKGEWIVKLDPMGKFIDIFGEVGMPIATIYIYSKDKTQDLANAHLIAAAPAMLEALHLMLRDYSSNPVEDKFFQACLKARQAITKAEGKE